MSALYCIVFLFGIILGLMSGIWFCQRQVDRLLNITEKQQEQQERIINIVLTLNNEKCISKK